MYLIRGQLDKSPNVCYTAGVTVTQGGAMTNQVLHTEEVVKLYKHLLKWRGKVSGQDVADELAIRGVRTHTGRPPTRQAIIWQMRKSNEGRVLLDLTRLRMGKGIRYNDAETIAEYCHREGFDVLSLAE